MKVSVQLAVCPTAAEVQQGLDLRLYFAWTMRQASSWYMLVMTQSDWTKTEVSDLM